MDRIVRTGLLVAAAIQIFVGVGAAIGDDWLVAWTHWLVALFALGWWFENGIHNATKRQLEEQRQYTDRLHRQLYGAQYRSGGAS